MEREAREIGCQVSNFHLLVEHGNQPHICSSNIFHSQHAVAYNRWLSTMAYGSEVYDQRNYDNCLCHQCFSYEVCPRRSFHHDIPTRRRCDNTEDELWPSLHSLSGAGNRLTNRDHNAMHQIEVSHPTLNSMIDSSFVRSLHKVYDHRYEEAYFDEAAYQRHSCLMSAGESWVAKTYEPELRNEQTSDEKYENDYIDVDNHNLYSDYNVTSTLCGLEEVLSRLI